MKILHISHSDIYGGAARAALRLHTNLIANGVNSKMKVRIKGSDFDTVDGPKTLITKKVNLLRTKIGNNINKLQRSNFQTLHSGGWVPSFLSNKINNSDYDIVHLHWVGHETMSIRDIGNINKKIVWTFHDMWPFSGTEHCALESNFSRWKHGYTNANRYQGDQGLDLAKICWAKKLKLWKNSINIVTPSSWLASCVKESKLFEDCDVNIIPNPLDTNVFKPLNKNLCRDILCIPQHKKVILFGAFGGTQDFIKGYDLFTGSMRILKELMPNSDIECIVFGQNSNDNKNILFDVRCLGHIDNDFFLSVIYSAADIMVVPSRIDNFPQTATEAQSCGVPVVGFETSGMNDVVINGVTGFLARKYDIDHMAEGIYKLLTYPEMLKQYSLNARARAVTEWDSRVVVEKYLNLYNSII